MPKATFFNLPEEKRNKIIEVIIDEYTTKPYNEVTTRVLTKKAEIPMGSFYQYFDNKDEAYKFIFHSLMERVISSVSFDFWDNYYSDITFNFVKEFEYKKLFTNKEIDFLESIRKVPEKTLFEINYDYNDKLEKVYKKEILKLINDNKISNEINIDFAVHIWCLISTNMIMYFRNNNITIKKHDTNNSAFIREFLLQRK